MDVKRLTGEFYEYVLLTHGLKRREIDQSKREIKQEYILRYIEELQSQIYHYVMFLEGSKELIEHNHNNEIVLKVEGRGYIVLVIKRLLSVSIYLQKEDTKYKKLLKCFALSTLEKVRSELQERLPVKINNRVIYQ